jgi:DNA helicase-2/ATP-dependent DNA helicase PcrA
MTALLNDLNPQQLASVTLPRESALILAGAGSGKTRVLTTRIAWLIQTAQAGPQAILAVTFTNKAAKEMLARISSLLPINTRGMWVGTFHGLCNRMLRAHYKDAALPQTFQILDTQDQLSAIKRLYKANGVDDERFPAKQLQYFINTAKEQGLRPAGCDARDDFNRRMIALYELYEAQCQREGVVDFAELLLRSHELLRNHPELAQHYRERFQHIMVDEFQDTNPLQYAWLKQIAGPSGCILAVGDDDQSIYAFRGARVANMAQFEKDFAVTHRIKLEQNYRSVGNILKAANHLIAHNQSRLGKNLWTESGEGEPLRVYEAVSDLQEAAWLIEEIKSLIAEGHSRSEVAVLYRSNAQSRVVEQALFSQGVPYRVYGGLRFFERAEVKHALAYLRLLENADDDNSFARIVNFPPRGIGARTLENLADAARPATSSLYRAVPLVAGKGGTVLTGFVQLIERLRFAARGLSLPDVVKLVINESGLIAHYRAERDGEDRIDNLEELINAAAAFCIAEGYADTQVAVEGDASRQLASPLAGFLSHASLEAGDNQALQGQDAVQLMTVHASKGLEFTIVFVTGLEEGLFPHENSIGSVMQGGDGATVDGVEEERRLMYVAMTRARLRLYLSFAQQRMLHGQTRYNLRSRFLDELPDDASLKWLAAPPPRATLMNQAWGAGPADTAAFKINQSRQQWPFKIGQTVAHTKFGAGLVVNYEGQGDDLRIQVNFGRQGMKWLALSLARLEAA